MNKPILAFIHKNVDKNDKVPEKRILLEETIVHRQKGE